MFNRKLISPFHVHEIDFLFVPCLFHLWSEVACIQICAGLNHRKKMKAEPNRLIPRKFTENLELLIDASFCCKYLCTSFVMTDFWSFVCEGRFDYFSV